MVFVNYLNNSFYKRKVTSNWLKSIDCKSEGLFIKLSFGLGHLIDSIICFICSSLADQTIII